MYTVFDPHFLRLKGETTDFLDGIVKHGIGGVGVDSRLLEDEKRALETARQVWDRGLQWSIMFTPVDFYAPTVDDAKFEEGLEILRRQCAVAEKMGVRYAYNHVWSSCEDRAFHENFQWHVRRIMRVQRVFENHGIYYGLEFLGPHEVLNRFRHKFVHTIAGVLSLADAAGGKCGFLFDTYHWYCGGGRMDDLYYALHHVDRMCGFHVNDGIAGRTREEQRDLERAMPLTTGVIDSATPYRLFRKYGYTGPVVCEPIQPFMEQAQDMSKEDCIKVFADVYRRLEG